MITKGWGVRVGPCESAIGEPESGGTSLREGERGWAAGVWVGRVGLRGLGGRDLPARRARPCRARQNLASPRSAADEPGLTRSGGGITCSPRPSPIRRPGDRCFSMPMTCQTHELEVNENGQEEGQEGQGQEEERQEEEVVAAGSLRSARLEIPRGAAERTTLLRCEPRVGPGRHVVRWWREGPEPRPRTAPRVPARPTLRPAAHARHERRA